MKNNRRIFIYLLLLATFFMSIGYASVNSVILDIEGLLTYKAQEGIYITNINYVSSTSTTENKNKILAGANTLINSSIELSKTDLNSQITYEITIYNSSNEDYAYNNTLYSEDEFFYDNDDIIIETNGINRLDKLEKGKFKTFTITFKYKSQLTKINNNKLNATINFDFNKLYTITYKDITNNNYRTYAIEGESLEITFTNKIPHDVVVTGSESYTYTSPTLNIVNVQSDIIISLSEEFELALYTFNGTTDYIDTGMKLFSQENINRDFEITFTVEELGYNIAFATLINAMDETGSPWPGFTFRYEDSNTGNLEMFTVANGNGRSNSDFLGTSIKKVKIQRLNNILYYQYDDGEIEEYFDFSGMRTTFDVPLTIGASLDGNGNPFRYFRGTLSNVTFKFLN